MGHTGLVCSECISGWTIQGEFCAACPPKSAFTKWPRIKLGAVIFIATFLFLLISIPYLMHPLLNPRRHIKRLTTRFNRSMGDDARTGKQSVTASQLLVRAYKVRFFHSKFYCLSLIIIRLTDLGVLRHARENGY